MARFVHHSCRQGNESLALVGEGNPASGPVQQAGVQIPLQRADLSRDGGLRASALLRGGRKRAGLRDPQKRLKRRDQILLTVLLALSVAGRSPPVRLT